MDKNRKRSRKVWSFAKPPLKIGSTLRRGNLPVSCAMSNEWISFSDTCLETPRQSVSPVAQVLRFTELALLNHNHDFESSKIWLVLSNWGRKPPSWLRRLAFCWFLFLSSLLSLFYRNILPQAWQEYFTTECFMCLLRLLSLLIVLPQVWQKYFTMIRTLPA